MATSTLIQYLETSQRDGFGNTVAVGTDSQNRNQTEVFVAAVAITVGDLVSLDLRSATSDGTKMVSVVPADLSSGDTLGVVGVATTAAAVGEKVTVVLKGIALVNADAGIAAGDGLSVSATGSGATAGFVAKRAAADLYTCVGVALEATGATVASQVKALIYKVW